MESPYNRLWKEIDEIMEEYKNYWIWNSPSDLSYGNGSKTILGVETMDKAQEIANKVNAVVNDPQYRFHWTNRKTHEDEYRPYPLNLKIANVDYPLNISIRPILVTSPMMSREVFEEIYLLKYELKNLKKIEIARMPKEKKEELKQKVHQIVCEIWTDEHKIYDVSWFKSGQSYRITYFDRDLERRKQASIGDIFIGVGAKEICWMRSKQRSTYLAGTVAEIPPFYLRTPLHLRGRK